MSAGFRSGLHVAGRADPVRVVVTLTDAIAMLDGFLAADDKQLVTACYDIIERSAGLDVDLIFAPEQVAA